MEAEREETVLPSLPSFTVEQPNSTIRPRNLPLTEITNPASSREEGIKNFELAALRELNSKVTTMSMPIDNSGELHHTVTCVEIANQSDLENLMDMVGDSNSYNVTLGVARFELPEEAGFLVSSVVGGTGSGFYWECPRTGEAPAVIESRPGDFGVIEKIQDQIRSEQGVQLEVGGLSYFGDTGLPVKEWCGTITTVTLGEQSDTLDHIEYISIPNVLLLRGYQQYVEVLTIVTMFLRTYQILLYWEPCA